MSEDYYVCMYVVQRRTNILDEIGFDEATDVCNHRAVTGIRQTPSNIQGHCFETNMDMEFSDSFFDTEQIS